MHRCNSIVHWCTLGVHSGVAPVQNTLRGHLLRDPQTRFAPSPDHFSDWPCFWPVSQDISILSTECLPTERPAARSRPSSTIGSSQRIPFLVWFVHLRLSDSRGECVVNPLAGHWGIDSSLHGLMHCSALVRPLRCLESCDSNQGSLDSDR